MKAQAGDQSYGLAAVESATHNASHPWRTPLAVLSDIFSCGRQPLEEACAKEMEAGLQKAASAANGAAANPLSESPAPAKPCGADDPAEDVVLHMECMSPAKAKATILLVHAGVLIGAAALFTQFAMMFKLDPKTGPLHGLQLPVINTTVASICLVLVTGMMGSYVERVVRGWRLGLSWSHRRRRFATLMFIELSVQWVNLVFWLAPNAYLLARRCHYFDPIEPWSALIRWSCWNLVFLLFLVHARNTNPWKGCQMMRRSASGSIDSIVLDAPLAHHAPLLLLWGAMQAAVFACVLNWTYGPDPKRPYRIHKPAGHEHDCGFWTYDCSYVPKQKALVIIMVAFAFIYFGVYLWIIHRTRIALRAKPYMEFKMDHLIMRLQMQMRMVVFTFFVLSVVLLWLVRPNTCVAFAFTWNGLLPMQVVMTASVLAWSFLTLPKDPDTMEHLAQAWRTDFAWTDAEKAAKLAARPPEVDPHEPVFCVATAMKALYWSKLVYRACDGQQATGKKETLEQGLAAWGLSEWGVEASQLFYERSLDTRCLVAWGGNTCVLAFRGTASMTNAMVDLQAWRMTHPPKRGHRLLGTRPLVHAGFLRSWRAGGLNDKVIACVLGALRNGPCAQGKNARVFVTGHSLGGALATIASYDIAKALQEAQLRFHLACYTFGAPRTGNHAFARDCDQVVPDSWSVINDQDVVARNGKLVMMYKRPGHRVVINAVGDMIVRPSFLQNSMHQVPGGSSVAHHLLSSYRRSLLAVMVAQFTPKGLPGGSAGVVALVQASPQVRALLEERMGMTLEQLEGLARLGPLAYRHFVDPRSASKKQRASYDRAASTLSLSLLEPSAVGLEDGSRQSSIQATPSEELNCAAAAVKVAGVTS